MPARDKTGPNGQGALTGRGLGPCGSGTARGFGRGCGRRAFFQGSNFTRTVTKDEEKQILEQELEEIETQKEEIKKRLKEL
jgi:hypothetical protein